jgi:hypothetical protein
MKYDEVDIDIENIEISIDNEAFDEINIPTEVAAEVVKRHTELLEKGISRSAIVSKEQVKIRNGVVTIWVSGYEHS